MKKALIIAVLAMAAFVPSALAADDPVSAVKADVAKLLSDAQAKHDTVVADANKLLADIQSIQAGGDRKAIRDMLKADVEKLHADRQAGIAQCESDRQQLEVDLKAVRAAHAGKGQLKDLLKQARGALKQYHEEIVAAVKAARDAEKAALQAFKK